MQAMYADEAWDEVPNFRSLLTLQIFKTKIDETFYLCYHQKAQFDNTPLLQSAIFLERLLRGNVPFFIQGVTEVGSKDVPLYHNLYLPPKSTWDLARDTEIEVSIINEQCYNLLLKGEESSLLDEIDFLGKHNEMNLLLFLSTCPLQPGETTDV